jgi:type IV secretory pathway VirB3-like protein
MAMFNSYVSLPEGIYVFAIYIYIYLFIYLFISTYIWAIFRVNVGKYSSTMEHLGHDIMANLPESRQKNDKFLAG